MLTTSLTACLEFSWLAPGLGDAVDVQAADAVQEKEEGRGEFAPEGQGEADERGLVPEQVHESQKPPARQHEGDQKQPGAYGPPGPCVLILAHLRHHEHLQAKDGSHHGQRGHATGQDHAHGQPGHLALTQVSEAVQPSLVGGGAEVPQAEETVLSKKPAPVTDGD